MLSFLARSLFRRHENMRSQNCFSFLFLVFCLVTSLHEIRLKRPSCDFIGLKGDLITFCTACDGAHIFDEAEVMISGRENKRKVYGLLPARLLLLSSNDSTSRQSTSLNSWPDKSCLFLSINILENRIDENKKFNCCLGLKSSLHKLILYATLCFDVLLFIQIEEKANIYTERVNKLERFGVSFAFCAIYFFLILIPFLSTVWCGAHINSTIEIETFTCGGGFWYTICYFLCNFLTLVSLLEIACSVFNFFSFPFHYSLLMFCLPTVRAEKLFRLACRFVWRVEMSQ